MNHTYPLSLTDIVANLERHQIDPHSLKWGHTRRNNAGDRTPVQWSLWVPTCQDFRHLVADWGGIRYDRDTSPTERTYQAYYREDGGYGQVGHLCHVGLPCWGRDVTDPEPEQGDLFGGAR